MDTSKIIRIICVNNTDPHWIIIVFADSPSITLPATMYEQIKDQFGLPDVVCDGNEYNG
jgi:hypothetical protein